MGAEPDAVLEAVVPVVFGAFLDVGLASVVPVLDGFEESALEESALVTVLRFGRLLGWSCAAI